MSPQLIDSEIDDLLYFARVGDCNEFLTLLNSYCMRENTGLSSLILTVKDPHSGNGPLHMASANGHTKVITEVVKALQSPSPLHHLQVAILNSQNAAGNTALHWAAVNGHLACVKALLDAGSDPTIRNAAGHDAVYEAELNDQKAVVDWVLTEATGFEEGIAKNNEMQEEIDESVGEERVHSKAGGDDADAEVLEAQMSNTTMEDER